jgi:Tfp pilus assembly protein PilF
LHLSTPRMAWLTAGPALLLLLAAPALASVESELAFHRGVVAYGEDQLDEAQRQFGIALAEDPEDTVTLHYLGLIAQKRDDPARALELYDRALASDPGDTDVLLDRGIALLDAGRLPEARAAFARVLELEPDRARAHLFAGIAAYRMSAYSEALSHVNRAGELDASIRTQSRYYAGLSEALMGNLANAEAAFGDVEQQSPLSPLGQSARNLRGQVKPAPLERRWQAELLGGMEYDSNPTIAGDIVSSDDDWRGVLRPSASYRFVQTEAAALTAGYDGYLSFHIDQTEVNLQTHSPWLSGGYSLGPVRLGLRYDYAFTFIDTTDPFRHLHRVTPSLSIPEGDWGVTYVNYQFHYQDYLNDLTAGQEPSLDRDGTRHMAGASQYFFLPEPFTYVRLGALADFVRTEGTEWSYNGWETSFGAGYDFPYEVSLTWLYRFFFRDYRNESYFATPQFSEKRRDRRHVLTVELAKALTEHWVVSVGGAFTWSHSNIPVYDYDRQVGGAYVTYRF